MEHKITFTSMLKCTKLRRSRISFSRNHPPNNTSRTYTVKNTIGKRYKIGNILWNKEGQEI